MNFRHIFLIILFLTTTLTAGLPIIKMVPPSEITSIFQQFLPENPVIIDAGAYDGTDGKRFAKKWPNSQVHCFEPIPQIFTLLCDNVQNMPNMFVYNCALSSENGTSEMFISEFRNTPGVPSHSASLRRPKDHLIHAPHVVFPRTVEVETFTIDTWAELHGIDHVDMMWLDMQGVELEVLKASPNIMATAQVIIIEVEFVEAYEGQSQYHEIKNWLEHQGFIMVWCNFDPNNPTQHDAYCGDVLFIKKDLFFQ